MANLYIDEGLGDVTVGGSVTVSGEEGRHAVRVSRLRIGETTLVSNGVGALAQGTVVTVDRDSFTIRVESVRESVPTSPKLILVQALAKGDRDERSVEQATEFCIDAIVPWQAERSVSRWDREKAVKGVVKWSRIAREATKQSMRLHIPAVHEPTTLTQLCDIASTAQVLVLHPRGNTRLTSWRPETTGTQDIYLVVGPEGGLTDNELARLTDSGAEIVLLGETVLRTSSAGPAAIAVLNATLGRW
ncbi:MAG: 16S rRNA (uracil(1498)-N(3))-methyltransferase [Leucobacter sp.]